MSMYPYLDYHLCHLKVGRRRLLHITIHLYLALRSVASCNFSAQLTYWWACDIAVFKRQYFSPIFRVSLVGNR